MEEFWEGVKASHLQEAGQKGSRRDAVLGGDLGRDFPKPKAPLVQTAVQRWLGA